MPASSSMAAAFETAVRNIHLIGLAGTPVTVTPSGTSRVTTAPAPTIAFSPIMTPAMIVAFEPILAPRLPCGHDRPVFLRLRRTVGVCRTRIFVVGEHHAVADENIVLDRHALTQE